MDNQPGNGSGRNCDLHGSTRANEGLKAGRTPQKPTIRQKPAPSPPPPKKTGDEGGKGS